MDPSLAEAFVDNGRATISWLESTTELRFTLLPSYPDYHPENPGGKPDGGRSLDPGLFSYASLGPWQDKVARSRRSAHLKITDTTLGGGTGFLDEAEMQRRVDNDLRGCGNALVGSADQGPARRRRRARARGRRPRISSSRMGGSREFDW